MVDAKDVSYSYQYRAAFVFYELHNILLQWDASKDWGFGFDEKDWRKLRMAMYKVREVIDKMPLREYEEKAREYEEKARSAR